MTKKFMLNLTIIFTLLASAFPVTVSQDLIVVAAEESTKDYEIYPTPHTITYLDGTLDLAGDIQVVYDETIDQVTKDKVQTIFRESGFNEPAVATEISDDKVNILVGTSNSNGPVDQYVSENITTENMDYNKIDAYHLVIKDNTISILGKDTDASFYGVVSLEAILAQATNNKIANLEIKDYANTKIRGFIEGYYGIPWSNEDRISLMEFGGKFKATSYIFAPKDDPYHRGKWDEPYPEEELEEIRKMAEVGNKTKTRFVWTISPLGEVAHIARTEGQEAAMALLEENTEKVLHKFEQLYDVGVRQFGVLGDDVGALPLEYVVELMDSVSEWAKEKGDVYDILYCPAAYNSGWAWDGGRELNRLEEGFADNIQIFWTGENTVGQVEQYTIDRFKTRNNNGVERRDPLFWLNWPVNDVDMSRVFLGKGEMLHPQIKNLAGVVTNPMQESEASKVAIFAIADYAWNTETFNASKSWEDSMKYIESNATEAFYTLAKHMSDAHPGGIRLEESEDIKKLLDTVTSQLVNGESIKDSAPTLITELQTIADAGDYFLENTQNEKLKEELEPFVKALRDMTLAAIEFLKADIDIESGDKETVWNSYSKALVLREQSLNYDRPLISGTLKAVPAAKRLQPFVDNLQNIVAEKIETALDIKPENRQAAIFTNVAKYKDLPLTEELDITSILDDSTITLDVNDFIGIKLSRIKDIAEIEVPTVDGLRLETSLNGVEWELVKDREKIKSGMYVRLINKTTDVIEFNLDSFKVLSNEVEQKSVHDTNVILYNSTAMALLDGKLSTHIWTDQPQTQGQYITYDLGQIIPIDNLKLYVGEGEGDFPRHAIIETSLDGKHWETAMTIGNQVGQNEGEGSDTDRIEEIFNNLEVPYRYTEAKGLNLDAKYLRFTITQTKIGTGNWLKMQEIVINDGELFPEVNDPTISSTSTATIGFGVNNINDGKLNSIFKPNNTKAGEVLYHLGEVEKVIKDITILEDPNQLSGATVSVRTPDGWSKLGVMDNGYKHLDTSEINQILDLKINWDEGNAPTIYEIQVNKELITEFDKTILGKEIAEAKEKEAADYTTDSWSTFSDALAAAEKVLAKEDATQAEIDEAADTLQQAIKGLVEVEDEIEIDRTALEEKLEEARQKEESNYTADSWSTFSNALAAAEKVLAKEDATQAEIDEAADKLQQTIKDLVEVEDEIEIDRTALEERLEEARQKEESNYTADSWSAFSGAFAAAEKVLAKEDATQAEIDEAADKLQQAVKGLLKFQVEIEIDRTALERELETARKKKENNYTTESWAALSGALAAAEKVLAKEDATQEEIDEAANKLQQAIKGLLKFQVEIEIDRTALEKELETARKKKENNYTTESWATFSDALAAAEKILAKEDATQAEINVAADELAMTIAGLKKEGHGLPKTATNIFNVLVVGVLILVIAIGLRMFYARRKNNQDE